MAVMIILTIQYAIHHLLHLLLTFSSTLLHRAQVLGLGQIISMTIISM